MKCAYCENEGKMSREHIIPKGFIEHMNPKQQIVWLDKAPTRIIDAEIKIKDVCTICNNNELSILDAYALNLMIKFNDKISVATKKVYFKCDYNLFTRWLLKVCYNSARVNDTHFDVSLYEKNVDYIMNRGDAISKIIVFAIYMGLDRLYEENNICNHLKKGRTHNIDWFRIGPFRLVNELTYYCASRLIMINSFAFLTVVCDAEHEDELITIREHVKKNSNFVELSQRGKPWLKKDSEFFLTSFETNIALRENFLRKRVNKRDGKYKILKLTKDEIDKADFLQLESMRLEFMSNKDDLMDCYQSMIIAIEGYENEDREIYQDKKFQDYSRKIFDHFPEIIWILALSLDVVSTTIIIQAYVNENYIDDKNDNSTVIKVDKEKAIKLLQNTFSAINKLTNKYAFDYNINAELSHKFEITYARALSMPE